MSETQDSDYELSEFEQKMEELNEGLLTAYAAGFAQAKRVYDIEDGPRGYRELMKTEGVAKSHFYFWDGKSKPLELWLHDLLVEEGDADE